MASGSPTMNKIEMAHQMYRDGKYREALDFYTDALSMAKNKPQKIALHSNRAACYLKLQDFKQAAEECTSVLELDCNHTGALMLRAQTLVTLKAYHSALFDVNRLIELNPSSEVYRNLQSRLKTQLSLAPIPEDEAELEGDDDDGFIVKAELEEDEEEIQGNKEVVKAELEEDEEEIQGNKEVEERKSQENDVMAAAVENKKGNECDNPIPAAEVGASQIHSMQKSSNQQSSGWKTIPKPKGHSNLDYSRWDRVEDDTSEEDDDDNDSEPQYRFRVKTVGVRAVK